jgi:cytochrome c peroxidase
VFIIRERLAAVTPLGRARKLADVVMSVPADNPLTEAKTALGRRLFFDPMLSIDKTVSCATCHLPERAFTDDKALAVGVMGRVGKRHSPSLVNRGFGRSHFWDGRSPTLEAQVLLPIEDPNEMAMTLPEAVTRLAADASYRDEFQAVFARPVESADLARALASFLRTIKSTDSPYDRFVAGAADALSPEAQQGLQIFRIKARCIFCHVEPLFTDESLHNTGVAWRPDADASGSGSFQDNGRYVVTSVQRDLGKFKTPTLREIALTAPYMHDGSLKTLADVVEFYDQGGRRNPFMTPLIRAIGLTAEEKQALVKFLESLTGTVSK